MSVLLRALFAVASVSTHQTVVPLITAFAGVLKSASLVAAEGAVAVMPPPPYWMPIGWSLVRSLPMLVMMPAFSAPAVWLAPDQVPACHVASPAVPEPGALITALIDVTPSWHDRQAIETEPTGATLPSSVEVPRLS